MARIGYPRQAVCVTCRAEVSITGKKQVKDNIITLSWHMPTSHFPELYAISVSQKRFSYGMIKNSGVFCVNFIPFEDRDRLLFCGRNTGKTTDKFEKTGWTKAECTKIDCCRIKEADAYMECKVVDEITTGDHTVFIGKVLKSEMLREGKKVFQVEGDKFTTTLE